jgi:hypothetical protein
MNSIFYKNIIVISELGKEGLDGYYIVMAAESVLFGLGGRTIGVKWLALFDSNTKTFCHSWTTSSEENIPTFSQEEFEARTIILFEEGSNIQNIPYFIYNNDGELDQEAYYHLICLKWLYNDQTEEISNFSDEDFETHKKECIETLKERRREVNEDRAKEQLKYKCLLLEEDQTLRDDLQKGSSNYESLTSKAIWSLAYYGMHFRANIVKEYCRKTFPEEFKEKDFKDVQDLCIIKGCRDIPCKSMQDRQIRGARYDNYMINDSEDIDLSYCLKHNTCNKCGVSDFWADRLCRKCDPLAIHEDKPVEKTVECKNCKDKMKPDEDMICDSCTMWKNAGREDLFDKRTC